MSIRGSSSSIILGFNDPITKKNYKSEDYFEELIRQDKSFILCLDKIRIIVAGFFSSENLRKEKKEYFFFMSYLLDEINKVYNRILNESAKEIDLSFFDESTLLYDLFYAKELKKQKMKCVYEAIDSIKEKQPYFKFSKYKKSKDKRIGSGLAESALFNLNYLSNKEYYTEKEKELFIYIKKIAKEVPYSSNMFNVLKERGLLDKFVETIKEIAEVELTTIPINEKNVPFLENVIDKKEFVYSFKNRRNSNKKSYLPFITEEEVAETIKALDFYEKIVEDIKKDGIDLSPDWDKIGDYLNYRLDLLKEIEYKNYKINHCYKLYLEKVNSLHPKLKGEVSFW